MQVSKKYKFLIAVIIVIGIFIFMISIHRDDSSVIQFPVLQLKETSTFLERDDSLFLASPRSILLINDKFYILDYTKTNIYKFNIDGKFLTTIGRVGSGPGEFRQPTRLSANNEEILILDRGNNRIQVLDLEGNYIRSIINPRQILTFTSHDELYYLHRSYVREPISDNLKLIAIVDKHGTLMHEFGDFFNFVHGMIPFASWPILRIYNDQLYVLFQQYPILHIYDLHGNMLKNIDLNEVDYRALIPNNYKKETFEDPSFIPLMTLFNSFHISDSGIYVMLYHDKNLIIDHYYLDGRMKQRFESDTFIPYAQDFAFIESENKITFYIIGNRPYPNVYVFESIHE